MSICDDFEKFVFEEGSEIFLMVVRGLPGSGKSTYANTAALMWNAVHVEADQFFVNDDGEYVFDNMKLRAAHAYCQHTTFENLYYKKRSVIVSNTFTTMKEMKPYFDFANDHGIRVFVVETQNEFGSIHDVPEETIEAMKQRFISREVVMEHNLVETYVTIFNKEV